MLYPLIWWLLALVVLAALGLSIGFYSVFRQLHERKNFRDAERLARKGKHKQALKKLLQAESKWMVNSHNGSIASCVEDYARLARIAQQIEVSTSALGCKVDVLQLIEAIDDLKRCLTGNNDMQPPINRGMTWSTAKDNVRLQDEIQACRKVLRAEVMHVCTDCETVPREDER